jgi:hypothetical protein
MVSPTTIHPEEATKKLLGVLPKRMKDIIELRFGLTRTAGRMTLEAIGDKYGITRERVRQIEADAFSRIQKSPHMQEMGGLFNELEQHFASYGGVIKEDIVLASLAPHSKFENHIYFLLSLAKPFSRFHENDDYHVRWASGKAADERAQKTLSHAVSEVKKIGKPISEPALYEVLAASAKTVTGEEFPKAALTQWLGVSKRIASNHFGEWGLVDFPSIKPRGVRDLSYMVMAKKTTPMHFSEVAKAIADLVGKKIHVQTVHNELIKDNRFVLVGRGLYGLREWGYEEGTVKDLVARVLKEQGPLSKDKVVSLVSAKRFVKANTISVNLDNKKLFKKLSDGRYSIK